MSGANAHAIALPYSSPDKAAKLWTTLAKATLLPLIAEFE